MWKAAANMWITNRQLVRFDRPVNARDASSATLLNFRTLPQCLQRPRLWAPPGLSISQ